MACDDSAYADHCHGLLRKLAGLYNKKGELKKKRAGYVVESRGLQRQGSGKVTRNPPSCLW